MGFRLLKMLALNRHALLAREMVRQETCDRHLRNETARAAPPHSDLQNGMESRYTEL